MFDMCIYLHRQLADMLQGWGGWCRLAFLTHSRHSACSLLSFGHVTSFHLVAEWWQKGGEQGREAVSPPLRWLGSPLQELALSTHGSAAKLSLHRHAALRAHPPISGASVPLIQT